MNKTMEIALAVQKDREKNAQPQEWIQDGAIVRRKSDGAMRFEALNPDEAYNAVERHNATIKKEPGV